MIEWLTVILLVVIGIVLIVLELVFVPGTTIVGILGLAFSVGSNFKNFVTTFQKTHKSIVLLIFPGIGNPARHRGRKTAKIPVAQ